MGSSAVKHQLLVETKNSKRDLAFLTWGEEKGRDSKKSGRGVGVGEKERGGGG